MTVLEIPPPPKQCPRCRQPLNAVLSPEYAMCSRGHRYKLNRDTGQWEGV